VEFGAPKCQRIAAGVQPQSGGAGGKGCEREQERELEDFPPDTLGAGDDPMLRRKS